MAKNIHAAATNAPAATAGMNATATSAANNCTAATVSVGGNTEPIAPRADKGSLQNAQSNTKLDKSAPTAPPPSQCLLWTDTVLSTEGHPFLVSFFAAGEAAATEAAFADALATMTTETTPATRANVGTVDPTGGHKLRENQLLPACSDAEHHHPSASTLASSTPASSAAAVDIGEAAGVGDISRMGRAMSILRHRRRQVKDTTNLEFDPRQHYTRAVNREDVAKRPRNAELDVMVRAMPFSNLDPCSCEQAPYYIHIFCRNRSTAAGCEKCVLRLGRGGQKRRLSCPIPSEWPGTCTNAYSVEAILCHDKFRGRNGRAVMDDEKAGCTILFFLGEFLLFLYLVDFSMTFFFPARICPSTIVDSTRSSILPTRSYLRTQSRLVDYNFCV